MTGPAVDNTTLPEWIIEWIWAPITGLILWIWIHVTSRLRAMSDKQSKDRSDADKRLSLMEVHLVNIESKLAEHDTRRREDRQEIMARIDKHAEQTYKKLDALAGKS